MPASGSPFTLKTTAATASADVTTVWYSVAANATQPTGVYTDTVTYTALTN
jgi:spore coat protein U-like protein